MFIDIDYSKRKNEVKLHLAKPNKRVIDIINPKFNDSMNIKLGNINELSFSIPYQIEVDGEIILNSQVNEIKEKMLVRVTLGTYKEWYIIDEISENSDDTDIFNVKAFSLGYENKAKRMSGLVEESINATDLLTKLLEPSNWKIGTVAPMFDGMFRSFESGDDSNVLDCIIQAGETFGALIEWNTVSRTVSFKDATASGKFRGLTVSYGRFLRSLTRTRTTDEMVTRMYVYGSEGLSIHAVNPTGQGYIEDFSYFMYPFERDVNRNVINSSHFMSDELCHAILDHKDLIEQNKDSIKVLTDDLATKQASLITEETTLTTLKGELTNIQGLLDIANATGDTELAEQRVAERNAKESEVTAQQLVVDGLKSEIADVQAQLTAKQDQISNQANFTPELLEELNLYVIESTWREDRHINVNDLYNDALVKFDEIRQPKVVIEVSIDNLLNIVEEQYYWDKLNLGDLIKVRYNEMGIEYMAKIMEINYDLANSEATLTIANTKDLLSDTDKLVQLLYSNSSATSMVQNNKYKWNKVNAVQEQVSQLLTDEWDATKQKIIAGVNNSVEVGNRGIIIKNPDYPDEVVIMQSGVIALSKDNGETWKTAIKPDGIVAERLIGRVIAGEELMITNSTGSFTMDNTGATFDVGSFIVRSSNGDNVVEQWQNASDFYTGFTDDNFLTIYEKKLLKEKWDVIASEHTANESKITNYYDVGIPETLDFVTAYRNAYTALYEYLFVEGVTPLLSTSGMSVASSVDGELYKTRFSNFDSAKIELERRLALRAIDLANQASQDAQDAQDRMDEIEDDVVYKTELHSTKGTLFSNGNIETTLFVVVYRGKENITSTLPNSAFRWRKTDENGIEDTAWSTAHNGVGYTISVDKDDVYKKAVFWCDIDIP